VIPATAGSIAARLDPSNGEARQWLEAELAKAAYQDHRDPLTRLLDAVERFFSELLASGIGASRPLPALAAGLVTALLLGLVLFSLRYVRRSHRLQNRGPERVLGGERLTGAQFRARAERALGEGRYADAVLDGVRALAQGAIERTVLDDIPSLTAHEIADRLGVAFPSHVSELGWAAGRFDEVAYGSDPATRDDAKRVLQLESALARTRARAVEGVR
jgi:hypothetical protein